MTLGHSVNSKSLDLWQQTFKDDEDVLLPLLYSSLKQEAILFIGLNPSFSHKGFGSLLRNTQFFNLDPSRFYHWRNRKNIDLEIALQVEQFAKDNYPYFNKFKDIAAHTNLEWEHIDLFFYRETSQAQFKKRIYKKKFLSDFARSQLELSKQLIVEANPKVIVVANALACSLFLKIVFPGINYDEKYGYHQILFENRSVPIFLASMLTGQRAMDNYSYWRLRWHIEKVVKDNGIC